MEEEYFFRNQPEWHDWLEINHLKSKGIWLIIYKKKSGTESLSYPQALEEALCFGWIDSKLQSLDSSRFRLRFTPRKERSVWSEINKKKTEGLIAEGRMKEAGYLTIKKARENGMWDNSYSQSKPLAGIDEAFVAALNANKEAKAFFEKLSNSGKLQYVFWINSAKRAETREKRIEKTIEYLNKHIKPGML